MSLNRDAPPFVPGGGGGQHAPAHKSTSPPKTVFVCSEAPSERNAVAHRIADENGFCLIEDDATNKEPALLLRSKLQQELEQQPRGFVIEGFLRQDRREFLCLLHVLDDLKLAINAAVYIEKDLKDAAMDFRGDSIHALYSHQPLPYDVCKTYLEKFDVMESETSVSAKLAHNISITLNMVLDDCEADDDTGGLIQVTDPQFCSDILTALHKTVPGTWRNEPTPDVTPGAVLDYANFTRRFFDLQEYNVYMHGIGAPCLLVKYQSHVFIIMPSGNIIFEAEAEGFPVPKRFLEISGDSQELLDFVFDIVMFQSAKENSFGLFLADVVSYKGKRCRKPWLQRRAFLRSLLPDKEGFFLLMEFESVSNIGRLFEKLKVQETKEGPTALCFVPPGPRRIGTDPDMLLYTLEEQGCDARLWNAQIVSDDAWLFDILLLDETGKETTMGNVSIDARTVENLNINNGHIVRVAKEGERIVFKSRRYWCTHPTSGRFFSENPAGSWGRSKLAGACAALKDIETN